MNKRRAQIEEAFHRAQDCGSAEEQARYLANVGANDPELRREVEGLLRSAEAADAVFPAAQDATDGIELGERPGMMIGRYKLLARIGEGGMGVVYLAEQQEPVRRKAALKIIKLGMDTRQVVARFEAERQALALMAHSNIAKVLDGGATESGRPYFVMELVEGVPITEFCAKNQLGIEQRLRLFILVCQAVQHAHQKGIIHRDLKPSNVMVTLHDGVPVPKVIDFGVAKATNQRLTEKTLFTQHATMIGTPAYMSPEQAEMSSDGAGDVDTRSDIYSLGVLLYELLTETQPFPEQRLRGVACAEMQRIILHEQPERPSTRLTRVRAKSCSRAHSSLRTPHSALEQDLDWIVLKCLEKDRNRRYETANGLAADLKRHLSDEPITARPPSLWYEFRKTVRRHKVGVLATAAVMMALAVGAAVGAWQAARARSRLRATVQLLNQTFTKVMPELRMMIGATKPREDLAVAASQIVKELFQDTEPSPEIRRVLGELYLQLAMVQGYQYAGPATGEFGDALESALKAIWFFQPAGSQRPTDQSLDRLIWAEMCAGFATQGLLRHDDALQHFEKMRQLAALLALSTNPAYANLGQVKVQWADWLTGDTLLLTGRAEAAMKDYFLPQLEQIRGRKILNDNDQTQSWEDLRDAYDAVGRCLLKLGRKDQAEVWLQQALPFAELVAENNPSHAAYACYPSQSKARLGEVLLALARPDEALPLLEDAAQLVARLQKRDPDNPGFVRLEIEVLQCRARGYASWAEDSAASSIERRQRLERAEAHLHQAECLVTGLKSESFRHLLCVEILSTAVQLQETREKLALPVTTSAGRSPDGAP
jgi:serine/threonine protein kinase/tetratricopeptide (TPR) repeat protein